MNKSKFSPSIFIAIVLLLITFTFSLVNAADQKTFQISTYKTKAVASVNGKQIDFYEPLQVIGGVVYAPLRSTMEQAECVINDTNKLENDSIYVRLTTLDKKTIHMFSGQNGVVFDNNYRYFKNPIINKDGKILVPLYEMLETLGYRVMQSEEAFDIKFLDAASSADQIILVTNKKASDVLAQITAYEKKEGVWKTVYSETGIVGTKGISTSPRHGYHASPSGSFTLTQAFGNSSDPGSRLPYRKVESNDYWVWDQKSKLYNTWQKYTKGVDWRQNQAEHLSDYIPEYNHAVVIDYNLERNVNAGAGFFFHITKALNGTLGCVALKEEHFSKYLLWLDPAKNPRMVISTESDLLKY